MIWWGLDEGRSKLSLYLKLLISKLNCPVIFYHSSIMKKFLAFGLKKDICFVANNTFHIPDQMKHINIRKNTYYLLGPLEKENN